METHGEKQVFPAWWWWVTAARAALALTLGVMVLLGDFGRPALANFIAVYWLVGALLTLRWAMAPPSRSRTGIIAAILGAAAALLVLGRWPLRHALGADTVLLVLGVAAVLTGLLRLGGGLRDGQLTPAGGRNGRRLVLGAFEIMLGAVLIVAQDVGRGVALIVGGWGIVGGTTLVLDALVVRRANRPPC